MEPLRLHVIDQLDRHQKIEFSPRPPQEAPTSHKPPTRKRTARLDPESVRAIRASLQAGESAADIAARHGISKMAVLHVRSGRSWGDVK